MGIKTKKHRTKKPALRSVGWMVVAMVRMQKRREEWAKNKRLHEALMVKLEETRKKRTTMKKVTFHSREKS
jgi:hypothetical protein